MLAVLFLVAPFYYHPNIGGEGLRIPNNITVWMLATIIIGYSLHLVLKRPTFVIPKYFLYIAAFPILITLSGFITGVEQPLQWLFRLLFIWVGLAFFFSLFQHKLKQGRLDRILFIIVVSGLLHGLIGVAQIWLQTNMPFWLPKSPNGYPSGLFQQVNNQATYQVTVIMIVAYLITRPFIRFAKPWLKSLLFLSLLCASFLVTASSSLIGLLTLVVGLLIVVPSQWQGFQKNKKIVLIALATLLIGLSLGSVQSNNKVFDKTIGERTITEKTVAMQSGYSGSERLAIYSISLDLIIQKPLYGHGIGSFPRVWQYSKPNFHQTHPSAVLPLRFVSHPHNEIMLWLVEGGLVAGLGLLLFVTGTFLAIKRMGWQNGGSYVAMLLPIALHTQVELPFYTSTIHWILFLTLLLTINNHCLSVKKNRSSIPMNILLKVGIVIFLGVSSLFLIHTLLSGRDFMNANQDQENNKIVFNYAKDNPYFRGEIEWISMGSLMYSSMSHGDPNNVRYVAEWAEKYSRNKPDVFVHYVLLDAYEYLGSKTEYCDIAKRGEAIFPVDSRLKKAKKQCDSDVKGK
jgi:O-antigen polymerase